MSETTAGEEYRCSPPPGSNREAVEADAPALLTVLDNHPALHVYTKSSPRFAEISKVRAETTDMEALAIVRPLNEAEISDTIIRCASEGIHLAIRSGGNDVAERSRNHGGVVIDVRSLDSMVLAPDRKSVRIGGGVTLGSLLKFLDSNGLDTPCGWGQEVGYVAWACGGGYGVECGSRGLGVDQIIGGRIVTASGEVLDLKPGKKEVEDAFWALRGGGAGVLGVVSELTVKVYTQPKVLAGYVWFPYAEAEKVFSNMQSLYEKSFPDNFAGEVFLVNPLGNGGVINHFFWWELKDDEGDLEDAKAYHQKIVECGTVILDTVRDKDGHYNRPTPYDFLYSFKSAGIETRQMVRNTSLVVPSFSAQLGAIIARHPLPTTISAVVLHNCHGAGTRRDPTAAFGNRDQHILVGFASQCDWTDEESKTLVSKWPVEVHDELVEAGLSTGWKYVNFNPPETGDGKMYLGQEGVKSMRKIKERWDPKGVFALNTPDLSE